MSSIRILTAAVTLLAGCSAIAGAAFACDDRVAGSCKVAPVTDSNEKAAEKPQEAQKKTARQTRSSSRRKSRASRRNARRNYAARRTSRRAARLSRSEIARSRGAVRRARAAEVETEPSAQTAALERRWRIAGPAAVEPTQTTPVEEESKPAVPLTSSAADGDLIFGPARLAARPTPLVTAAAVEPADAVGQAPALSDGEGRNALGPEQVSASRAQPAAPAKAESRASDKAPPPASQARAAPPALATSGATDMTTLRLMFLALGGVLALGTVARIALS